MPFANYLLALHRQCGCAKATGRFASGNWSLVLPTAHCIAIDCDTCRAFPVGDRKPDAIILLVASDGEPVRWLIVELKTTVSSASHSTSQLQAGAHAIANHTLFRAPATPSITIQPLVVHAKGVAHAAARGIDKRTVTFRRDNVPITTRRCGAAIALAMPR